MRLKKNSHHKVQYSKIYPIITTLLFIVTLIEISILKLKGMDTSDFSTQQLVSTGGLCGAAILGYYNKEKMFNIARVKMALVQWEYEFIHKNKLEQEDIDKIKDSTSGMESTINSQMESDLSNTMQDIDIPSFY